MEKFVNALSEGIKEKYPNLQLEAQFTGSGAGLEAVASKNNRYRRFFSCFNR